MHFWHMYNTHEIQFTTIQSIKNRLHIEEIGISFIILVSILNALLIVFCRHTCTYLVALYLSLLPHYTRI